MESIIAAELKLRHQPVAVIFTDQKPNGALQFKEGTQGCAVAMFTAASMGKTTAIDRNTAGCTGSLAGLCLGSKYEDMKGGIDYFLSTGRGEGYPEGEAYKKTPELAQKYIDALPIVDIPFTYVVFKPLSAVDPEGEPPVLVSFYAAPDQMSALVVLANYGRAGSDNVIIPFSSACSTLCLIPYNESLKPEPKAVVGITDISARPFVDPDILSFTVPWAMFRQMEADAPGSFLDKVSWKKVRERIPSPVLD